MFEGKKTVPHYFLRYGLLDLFSLGPAFPEHPEAEP